MAKQTCTTFTCSGCSVQQEVDNAYITAPMGWRMLTWNGAYSGDESREAYFCDKCRSVFLNVLDHVLEMRR